MRSTVSSASLAQRMTGRLHTPSCSLGSGLVGQYRPPPPAIDPTPDPPTGPGLPGFSDPSVLRGLGEQFGVTLAK
jgi:hypothetical protein